MFTDLIQELFNPVVSRDGEKEDETRTYMIFTQFLTESQGSYTLNSHAFVSIILYRCQWWRWCNLEDILIFFTGTDTIPPTGLPEKPALKFDSNEIYLTASTCLLQLVLPTRLMQHSSSTLILHLSAMEDLGEPNVTLLTFKWSYFM